MAREDEADSATAQFYTRQGKHPPDRRTPRTRSATRSSAAVLERKDVVDAIVAVPRRTAAKTERAGVKPIVLQVGDPQVNTRTPNAPT